MKGITKKRGQAKMEIKEYQAAMEAVLFACAEPLPLPRLAEALELDEETAARLAEDLMQDINTRAGGIRMVQLDDAYQLCTNTAYAEQVRRASDIYFQWQAEGTDGTRYAEPELYRSVDIEELKANDYSLVPSRYIEFVDRDANIDFHKVLTETASTVADLLKRQRQNDETLRNALKQLGYGCE
jgi:hypothetical protein